MKKKVSPLVAVAAAVLVMALAAFAFWRSENSGPRPGDPSLSAMPPQVGEELKKRMGGVQPPTQTAR
jgi:hypothetical protein